MELVGRFVKSNISLIFRLPNALRCSVKVMRQHTGTLVYLVIFETDVLWQILAALLRALHCGYLHLFLLQISTVHSDPVPFLSFF
jgi:hypothetical protein